MSDNNYKYVDTGTEELTVETLNALFIDNSDAIDILYEKLKKREESKREIFIKKMASNILMEKIYAGFSKKNIEVILEETRKYEHLVSNDLNFFGFSESNSNEKNAFSEEELSRELSKDSSFFML